MMLKTAKFAAAFALGMATAAQAEDHTIVVTGFSYFPAVTYVLPGETVTFVNESGEEQTVVGKDAGWVVGPLADGADGSLTVTEETELKFFSAYQNCENGNEGTDVNCGSGNDPDPASTDPATGTDGPTEQYGNYEDAPIKAEITFDAPPLNG